MGAGVGAGTGAGAGVGTDGRDGAAGSFIAGRAGAVVVAGAEVVGAVVVGLVVAGAGVPPSVGVAPAAFSAASTAFFSAEDLARLRAAAYFAEFARARAADCF